MNNAIAIIIPFYKITYFEQLLESLSHQDDKRFNLYVGNDNSPDDPREILYKFKDKLKITYHKYTENLGHICPTHQWNRCLNLAKDEEWIWVLPDDDLVSPNCVEEFYKSLPEVNSLNINLMTIPSRIVDKNGSAKTELIINKKIQTVYNFYFNQLKGCSTGSSLGDNIFRRSILVNSGGFISFPRAWGSDHATILNTAAKSHVYCLQNAWFGFRQSGINISSDRTDGVSKLSARIKFLNWIKNNEFIFNRKPDLIFYKYFYWKAEYYVINEWDNSPALYYHLLRLRWLAIKSINPPSIAKLFVKKIITKVSGSKVTSVESRHDHRQEDRRPQA